MNSTDDFYNFECMYYDSLYGGFREDVDFYNAIGVRSPVLEIFAGTGRIISRFENGIGLERNLRMLMKGENKFIKVQGDARKLPFKSVFNTVIVGLNSFLLLPDEEKQGMLGEVRSVIVKGGILFIDVINGFSLNRGTYNVTHFKGTEIEISLKMKAKREGDKYLLRYYYSIKKPEKMKVLNTITIYPTSYYGLRSMLHSKGFDVEKVFGDYDLSPFKENSEKMIIKARAV